MLTPLQFWFLFGSNKSLVYNCNHDGTLPLLSFQILQQKHLLLFQLLTIQKTILYCLCNKLLFNCAMKWFWIKINFNHQSIFERSQTIKSKMKILSFVILLIYSLINSKQKYWSILFIISGGMSLLIPYKNLKLLWGIEI